MPKSDDPPSRAQHSLHVIEEVMRSIRAMSLHERETLMQILQLWMKDDKFGFEGKYVLASLHRYCITECLLEDPGWKPRDEPAE